MNAPHTTWIAVGGTREKYESVGDTAQQQRLLRDERYGPEGARTRNVTLVHRKRNYCRLLTATIRPRPIRDQFAAGDDPR